MVGGFPDAGWQGKSRCGKSGLFSQRVQLSGTGRPDSLRLRFLSPAALAPHPSGSPDAPAVSRNSTPTAARFSQRTAAVCQAAAAMQRAGQPSTGGKGRPSPEKSDFRPGRTAYVPAVDSRQWTELFFRTVESSYYIGFLRHSSRRRFHSSYTFRAAENQGR